MIKLIFQWLVREAYVFDLLPIPEVPQRAVAPDTDARGGTRSAEGITVVRGYFEHHTKEYSVFPFQTFIGEEAVAVRSSSCPTKQLSDPAAIRLSGYLTERLGWLAGIERAGVARSSSRRVWSVGEDG